MKDENYELNIISDIAETLFKLGKDIGEIKRENPLKLFRVIIGSGLLFDSTHEEFVIAAKDKIEAGEIALSKIKHQSLKNEILWNEEMTVSDNGYRIGLI